MKAAGFVIHLNRAIERRAQADAIAAALPVPTTVLSAIDARHMSDAEREAVYRPRQMVPRFPFRLTAGEVACFLSHRLCWQRMLEQGLDAAIIAEDDVAVDHPALRDMLAFALDRMDTDDFVRLPKSARGETGPIIAEKDEKVLIAPDLVGLNMQMQVVGAGAARRLLAATQVFDRPVDVLVQMSWVHGARVLSARPIVIRELSGGMGGSLIQNRNKSLTARLHHEIARPIFRFQLRREARRQADARQGRL
jgi:GR25 family glycosyltransferase involved in LPS biosynthesis